MHAATKAVFEVAGEIEPEDVCRVCRGDGNLLCCDICPAVFHLTCLNPPLLAVPEDAWYCKGCVSSVCRGVLDCVPPNEPERMLRSLHLGEDRYHRRYVFVSVSWLPFRRQPLFLTVAPLLAPLLTSTCVYVHRYTFAARRVFVEGESGDSVYYSSPEQLDALLAVLSVEREPELVDTLEELYPKLVTQMKWTVTYVDPMCQMLDCCAHCILFAGPNRPKFLRFRFTTQTKVSETRHLDPPSKRHLCPSGPYDTFPPSSSESDAFSAWLARGNSHEIRVYDLPASATTAAASNDSTAVPESGGAVAAEIGLTGQEEEVGEANAMVSSSSIEIGTAVADGEGTVDIDAMPIADRQSHDDLPVYEIGIGGAAPPGGAGTAIGVNGMEVSPTSSPSRYPVRSNRNSGVNENPESDIIVVDPVVKELPPTLRQCAGMGISIEQVFEFFSTESQGGGIAGMWRPGDAEEFRGYVAPLTE